MTVVVPSRMDTLITDSPFWLALGVIASRRLLVVFTGTLIGPVRASCITRIVFAEATLALVMLSARSMSLTAKTIFVLESSSDENPVRRSRRRRAVVNGANREPKLGRVGRTTIRHKRLDQVGPRKVGRWRDSERTLIGIGRGDDQVRVDDQSTRRLRARERPGRQFVRIRVLIIHEHGDGERYVFRRRLVRNRTGSRELFPGSGSTPFSIDPESENVSSNA